MVLPSLRVEFGQRRSGYEPASDRPIGFRCCEAKKFLPKLHLQYGRNDYLRKGHGCRTVERARTPLKGMSGGLIEERCRGEVKEPARREDTVNLIAIPRLADLAEDSSRVKAVPIEAVPELRAELARLDSLLLTRLFSPGNADVEQSAEGDRLLSAREAAAKLGASADYLYRHSRNLPFTVRVGRKLRFSEAGIERFIRARLGR